LSIDYRDIKKKVRNPDCK